MDRKAEILGLENRFWQAMIDKDVDGAADLVAENCIVTGAQGAASIDRAAFAKIMAEGKWELHKFSFDKVQVVSPAPGVAAIGYVVTEELTVDGKKMTLQAADASTWCKEDGQWRCVLHTESVLGDPFGRDKAKGAAKKKKAGPGSAESDPQELTPAEADLHRAQLDRQPAEG